MIKPYSPIAGPVVGGDGFKERTEGTLREDKHQIKPVPRTETEKGRPEYRAALARNPEMRIRSLPRSSRRYGCGPPARPQ